MTVDLTSATGLGSIGPRITAQILGSPYQQYRPFGVAAAIVPGNLIATIPAWITADPGLTSKASPVPEKPVRYAAVDPNLTQPGDYLIGPQGTLFIRSQILPEPIALISCTHTLNITRMPATVTPGGSDTYGGDVAASETPILTGWPGAVAMGLRMVPGSLGVPSESKQGMATVFLPPSVTVQILENDVLTDENGKRFAITSAEQSSFGWRLMVEEWEG